MQNRYVGDVGDFGKYGLLRYLAGAQGSVTVEKPLRLGVVWYLHPDESHNSDGKHVGYLEDTPTNHRIFRECDPELYETLSELITSNQRSISKVRSSGILPQDTRYYEEALFFPRESPRSSRRAMRQEWLRGAVDVATQVDVVFVDPDNGVTETVSPYQKNGPKFVFIDDLRRFVDGGQTLVIYHHLGRQGTAIEQIKRVSEHLQQSLGLWGSPWSLRFRRGSARVYFVIPSLWHQDALQSRVTEFLESAWASHFELVQ